MLAQLDALDAALARARHDRDRRSTASPLALGGRTVLGDVTLRHRGGRVRRRARAERRGQDHADARDPRPGAAARPARSAVLGQPPARGNPAIGYMPQARSTRRASRSAAATSSRSAAGGHRWGLPLPEPRRRAREVDWALDLVGATALARRPLAELSGGERQRLLLAQALLGRPEPAAAGRAADQPRPAPPARGRGAGARAAARARHHGAVQRARTQPAAAARWTGCSISAAARRRSARWTRSSPGPVLSRLYGAAIEVVHAGRPHLRDVRRGRRSSGDAHRHAGLRRSMFAYDFMGTPSRPPAIVAVVAGAVGYFLVLRGQTFAGHALAHVGFTGATGAVLIGMPPLWGLVLLTVAAGVGMGLLGERLAERDVAIGIVLAAGARPRPAVPAFLHRVRDAGDGAAVRQRARRRSRRRSGRCSASASSASAALAAHRPAAAVREPAAGAGRGARRAVRLVSAAVPGASSALAVAECAQIVGVLLVFTLMVGPAAAAQRLTTRLGPGWRSRSALALAEAWAGIALACWTDWPTSFWITALSGAAYLLACVPQRAGPAGAGCRRPSRAGRRRRGFRMGEALADDRGAEGVGGEGRVSLARVADARHAVVVEPDGRMAIAAARDAEAAR